jgi:hypothetical protein
LGAQNGAWRIAEFNCSKKGGWLLVGDSNRYEDFYFDEIDSNEIKRSSGICPIDLVSDEKEDMSLF